MVERWFDRDLTGNNDLASTTVTVSWIDLRATEPGTIATQDLVGMSHVLCFTCGCDLVNR